MTDDARTLDFLEGGGTLTYDPKAPDLTPAQLEERERTRLRAAQQKVADDAAKTSDINARAYWSERAKTDRETIAMSNAYAAWAKVNHPNGAWNFGSLDLGLLPVAVVVVKDLVLLAVTGGLDAPNVAKDFKNFKETIKSVKSVGSAKDFAENVSKAKQSLQDRIDRTRAVFTVPNAKGDSAAAASSVADRILASPNGGDVVANTRDLALSGDVDAQRGMLILARVAGARISGNVSPGQVMIQPKTPEQAAQVAAALPRTVRTLTDSETETLVGVRSWWQRFVDWLTQI